MTATIPCPPPCPDDTAPMRELTFDLDEPASASDSGWTTDLYPGSFQDDPIDLTDESLETD